MARERLVIHVGLPKTASTVIQRRVLADLPGNLGKPKKRPEVSRMRRLVTRIGAGRDSDEEVARLARLWWREFETLAEDARPGAAGYIYSEERPGSPGLGPKRIPPARHLSLHPAARFVRAIADNSLRDLDIHVVLAIRSQATFLASLYSQQSFNVPFSSQRAFERHVGRVLRRRGFRGRDGLDWNRLVTDLATVAGADRLTVLVFEEIGTDRFWEDLASVLRLEKINPELRSPPQPGEANRRSGDESDRWRLRPLREGRRVSTALRKNGIPAMRRTWWRMLCELDHLVTRAPRGEIELTAELRAVVSSTYRRSNDQLSARLGRDLKELGYY